MLRSLLLIAAGWLIIAIIRTVRLKKSLANLNVSGVRFWLEHLYQSRQSRAYVIFEDMDGSERFVQFSREVGDGGASLTCDFPIAEWLNVYVEPLERLLDEIGVGYVRRPFTEGGSVNGFVVCENLDPATATTLTDTIFRRVFGHSELLVRVWGNNLSPLAPTKYQMHDA